MKKLFAVGLSVLMVLLLFSSCGKSTTDDNYFIGCVTDIPNGQIQIFVYSQYFDKYGETVKLGTDRYNNKLKIGDEVRVYVEEINGENVNPSQIDILLYNCDSEAFTNFDKLIVPKDFPNFLGDVSFTFNESNCFSSRPYRVVKQDERETYLAYYYETSAQFVIYGNTQSDCAVGDFVLVETGKYKQSNAYCAVEKQHLTKLDVIAVDDLANKILPEHNGDAVLKPVIYLYPEKDTIVDVNLELDYELTCTYPDYDNGNGWKNLNVSPNGTIEKQGREYYCLYWEGDGFKKADFPKGFCIKGDETADFLETVLAEIGLNEREANEFIIYWLPVLQENEYNLISFQGDNYTDSARLDISPKPNSVLRVFMSYKPLDEYIEIEPQTFERFERKGFTVVEWGGGPVAK